jgi:hypothetical protein
MKYFYLYIFLLLGFIFIVSYYNTYINSYKESFNSEKQIFVLLGDSILKNDRYVSNGQSLQFLLMERTNNKTHCYAVDDSKIIDVYKQIDEIPYEFNTSYTTIFLSIGGNDILQNCLENNANCNKTDLVPMFSAYKNLIKSIQTKFPNANIVVLDIYYPNNLKYKQYHELIDEWNNMIYDYARESSKNNITSVLKISNILTHPDDFTLDIEPSAIGTKKMVDIILSSY